MDYLPCIEINPNEKAEASVIWLHGLGATGNDFESVAEMLIGSMPVPTRFVLPHAPSIPVTINGGMVMPAWYDLIDMGHPRNVDWDTVKNSEIQIQNLIQRELDSGIAPEKIVIAGFSQGGAIAYRVALAFGKKLAGILALSTYILKEGDEVLQSEYNEKISIFIAHGNMDPVIPLALAEQSKEDLSELGCDLEYKVYPMPHSVCEPEIEDINVWLNKVLA